MKIGDRYGYINKQGQYVINLKLLDGYGFGWWNFSEGLAPVYSTDSGYGYINREGQWVIKPQFDDAEDFSEGLAHVKIGDRYGYINKEGQVVIKPQFDYARFFSEGLAAVKIGEKWGYISKGSFEK